MTRRLVRIGCVALSLSLAGPVAARAQSGTERMLLAELRMVSEQLAQLKLVVNGLIEQNKTITTRLDAQAADQVTRFANQANQIKEITAELRTVREKLDTNNVSVQRLTSELDAIRKGTDALTQLVSQLSAQVAQAQSGGSGGGSTTTNTTPVTSGGGGGSTLPVTPPSVASPTAYFQQAMGFYAVGQLDFAIDAFKDVVTKFPDSPYAPSAQFLIGESYHLAGNYKEAIKAYSVLIDKFPGAEDVPMAYYKQGLCFEQLKQNAEAIKLYQLVVKQFPTSTAAVNATQRLRTLKVG